MNDEQFELALKDLDWAKERFEGILNLDTDQALEDLNWLKDRLTTILFVIPKLEILRNWEKHIQELEDNSSFFKLKIKEFQDYLKVLNAEISGLKKRANEIEKEAKDREQMLLDRAQARANEILSDAEADRLQTVASMQKYEKVIEQLKRDITVREDQLKHVSAEHSKKSNQLADVVRRLNEIKGTVF